MVSCGDEKELRLEGRTWWEWDCLVLLYEFCSGID